MEWPMEETYKLINLYNQFPCLWDYQSSSYKRNDMKKNAWEEIAKSMDKNLEVVKKKMKHLRSAYLLEKKKVDSSKKSGSSADDVYVPHLFYYHEMSFLENVVGLRQTTCNLNLLKEEPDLVEYSPKFDCTDICDSQESCKSLESDTPTTSRQQFNARKRKAERDHKINYAIEEIIKKTKDCEEETVFSHFGASVGMQLTSLNYAIAMRLMAEIQALLSGEAEKEDKIKKAMINANII